ncbi:MAG: hypothetical protein GOP50_07105 [Candidatus Heimdallarchaeota archaeon]|nr:hypothetical protein [Candidatus Heimdallarchaeota archaeon]
MHNDSRRRKLRIRRIIVLIFILALAIVSYIFSDGLLRFLLLFFVSISTAISLILFLIRNKKERKENNDILPDLPEIEFPSSAENDFVIYPEK